MASTVKLTSELAARTAHAVTQDVESWKQYLTTASRLYKMYVVKGECEISPNTT